MKGVTDTRHNAFTLVELLTVIAIISLLIGILIPSIAAARNQAKAGTSRAQISSIGKAAESFHGENDHYPLSRGENPFESSVVALNGAQWLTMQLSGPELAGYVRPVLQNDTNADGEINWDDWLEWYSLSPKRKYARSGPYMSADPKSAMTPEVFGAKYPATIFPSGTLLLGNDTKLPFSGDGGGSEWNNGHIPFYVDAFGNPILYYAANAGADKPFTTGNPGSNFSVGRYDMSDNASFTGADGNDGFFSINTPGLTLERQSSTGHDIATLGWDPGSNPNLWPQYVSFARYFADRNIFETTARGDADNPGTEGKIWPYNADTFILLSPGKDGTYGTNDDIANYERSGL